MISGIARIWCTSIRVLAVINADSNRVDIGVLVYDRQEVIYRGKIVNTQVCTIDVSEIAWAG